jgi:hypothetical protein
MKLLTPLWSLLACALLSITENAGIQAADVDLYQTEVAPYLNAYCVRCHGADVSKGELDFSQFQSSQDVIRTFRRWNHVVDFIRDGEMPPEAAKQPTIPESNDVVKAIETILLTEARNRAGDPGVVLPRRLSNTEYDRSIHDLTGFDIRPTKSFPADPAGGEGFDNTGEALGMSPNLLKKYLAASEVVASHLVLKPSGIAFAANPITSYNERKSLTEQAVIDFYLEHNVDLMDYFTSAWRFQHRRGELQDLSIEAWAQRQQLSGKYMSLVYDSLQPAPTGGDVMSRLRTLWRAVPPPREDDPLAKNVPAELQQVHAYVRFGNRVISPPPQQLIRAGAGNWPISHLDFRQKTASQRDKFAPNSMKNNVLLNVGRIEKPRDDAKPYSIFLRIEKGFGDTAARVIVKRPMFSLADRLPNNEADEKEHHKIQTLKSVLETHSPELAKQLYFGQKQPGERATPESDKPDLSKPDLSKPDLSNGEQVGDESFVLNAPAVLEIPITVEMQQALAGKNLLLPCFLDGKLSRNASVLVDYSRKESPRENYSDNVQHLIFGDSETAIALVPSAGEFCHVFPNRFFYVDSGRGLAAGFHLVEGFFRDDQPLINKVLSDGERAELDELWRELDFVTRRTETLLRGFVWFERSERHVLHDQRFDFLRAEDPALVEQPLLDRFEKAYLDKMGIERVGETLEAIRPDDKYLMIHGFFERTRAGLKTRREALAAVEPLATADLARLAERAYGRPLTPSEQASLKGLYQILRAEGQDVEAAVRGVFSAILMSPEFCYHYRRTPSGNQATPLNDYDLASRMSYFLWGTLPDGALLEAARAGQLRQEDGLLRQTRRMLQDEKIESFAREFLGQWLQYHDFMERNPVNAAAFPGYDDGLRQAMLEEPVRLATHLIQNDQPITSLLDSDMTFVNARLAKHYGTVIEQQFAGKLNVERNSGVSVDQPWLPVSGLHEEGRGGLFGMAVVLTTNSAGERTSPVKRGFWSVHHLLGQHFPPPPADVPELPKSEKDASKSIRELLKSHVEAPQCALCHTHFDSLGLAMEGFDPIGRRRQKDGAGRKIDNVARLPNGEDSEGIPGLIAYIEQHRKDDFTKTICRKFLGYALGRSVELSDQPLLTKMGKALKDNNYRFSVMFEMVVASPQFRQQRGER